MADHAEKRQTNPEAAAVFRLVAEGRLPAAQGLSVTTDEPLWSLAGLAAILGIDLADLLDHLRQGPPRFAVDPGKPGVERVSAFGEVTGAGLLPPVQPAPHSPRHWLGVR